MSALLAVTRHISSSRPHLPTILAAAQFAFRKRPRQDRAEAVAEVRAAA